MSKSMYREILKKMIKNEKDTQKKLAEVYRKALKDIKIDLAKASLEGDELNYERLMAIELQLSKGLKDIYDNNYKIISDHGFVQYQDRYYYNIYQAEKELGISTNFALLDPKDVERAINIPIGGISLNDRLKHINKDKMERAIREQLIQGVIKGSSYGDLANNLSEELEMDYNRALRIMRTEGGRLASVGNLESMEELDRLGVEVEKQWLATLDDRTRDAHAELDGQTVPVDGYFEIGGYEAEGPHLFGVPELDINCRCDVITIVNGISPDYRRDNISKAVVDYEDYDEWFEERVTT